jgi:hypothetical protein
MRNKYTNRDLEPVLTSLLKQFPVIAITGPRQSGKSTLLKHALSASYRYFSFDDPAIRETATHDPRLFLENAGEKIILDEIQYVPQLLSYIKILVDENRHKNGRYVLTGSQQFSLIKNLADSLAGRIALLELLPFSVAEKKKTLSGKSFSGAKQYFIDACLKGSFPQLVTSTSVDRSFWYSSYIQTYLERDVRSVHNIGNLMDFQKFLTVLASRCGQVLNLSSISVDIGASVNTLKRWLSILEASRIIFLLPPYYNNFGKRVTKNPKLYFMDCGLVCHLLSIKDKEYLLRGPMAGPLFENFCIQEVIKNFFGRGIRPNIYFVRMRQELEVDMLIEKDSALFPVEFKLSRTPRREMAVQMERLKDIFPKWNLKTGNILSLSEDTAPLTENVWVLSFDDFMRAL